MDHDDDDDDDATDTAILAVHVAVKLITKVGATFYFLPPLVTLFALSNAMYNVYLDLT